MSSDQPRGEWRALLCVLAQERRRGRKLLVGFESSLRYRLSEPETIEVALRRGVRRIYLVPAKKSAAKVLRNAANVVNAVSLTWNRISTIRRHCTRNRHGLDCYLADIVLASRVMGFLDAEACEFVANFKNLHLTKESRKELRRKAVEALSRIEVQFPNLGRESQIKRAAASLGIKSRAFRNRLSF